MKRAKESGAYYRNKKKVKEENIRKNEGSILKFVKLSDTPECAAASPDSTPGPSGVSSSETSVVRIQEVAEIEQIADTDHLQPLIDSRYLSNSNTSAVIAEIPTPKQNIDLNHIGKWPESIESNIRLLLIQRGPEVVQHMNTDFSEESTVSRTVQSDMHSTTLKVLSRRRLTRDWFYRTLPNGEKVLRSWMAYSPSKASLFCFCCRLFENANSSNASKFHSTDGLNTWWKLNPKVSKHELSSQHNEKFCKWKELEKRLLKGQTIDKKEQEVLTKETKKWHEILTRIFDII